MSAEWLHWAQLIVGVHRMFYCDSSDYSSNDNGDQTMAARQRAALEEVFNQYKARALTPFSCILFFRFAKPSTASDLCITRTR